MAGSSVHLYTIAHGEPSGLVPRIAGRILEGFGAARCASARRRVSYGRSELELTKAARAAAAAGKKKRTHWHICLLIVSPLATLAFKQCAVGDTGLKTGWVRYRHGAGAGRGGAGGVGIIIHACTRHFGQSHNPPF